MSKFKLFNTDGETFFDFRSSPDSRCEGFTLTFCDDGTTVVTGDYGNLCWKRGPNNDYGFPNKKTDISYFAQKVGQFGIKQVIKEFNMDHAMKIIKKEFQNEEYKEDEETKQKVKDCLEQLKFIEDYDEVSVYHTLQEFFEYTEWHEYGFEKYVDQFEFLFNTLKEVSNQVIHAVDKKKKEFEK